MTQILSFNWQPNTDVKINRLIIIFFLISTLASNNNHHIICLLTWWHMTEQILENNVIIVIFISPINQTLISYIHIVDYLSALHFKCQSTQHTIKNKKIARSHSSQRTAAKAKAGKVSTLLSRLKSSHAKKTICKCTFPTLEPNITHFAVSLENKE